VEGDRETPGDRLMQAFDMFEFGIEVMAANLKRRHPTAAPEELERLLEAWLADRPGAELGDADGIPVQFPTLR
jgi:hypothetical protein